MTDETETFPDEDIAALVARLERERPRPGPTLQRRVRRRIRVAFRDAHLRRQAVALWIAGSLFLLAGLVMALSGAPQ